jgi:peptidoglycan hydrolase CwlO-like protein
LQHNIEELDEKINDMQAKVDDEDGESRNV